MTCIAPPATKLHPAEIILDEMRERGWSIAHLVEEMGPFASETDHQIEYLAVEMYLEVQEPFFLIGGLAQGFGKAFGLDAEFFTKLHNAWRDQAMAKEDAHGGF